MLDYCKALARLTTPDWATECGYMSNQVALQCQTTLGRQP